MDHFSQAEREQAAAWKKRSGESSSSTYSCGSVKGASNQAPPAPCVVIWNDLDIDVGKRKRSLSHPIGILLANV